MIDESLAEAFIHRAHRVMLRQLRPFSLRHLFALLILENPLIEAGRDVTWPDLEVAVTVCALRNPLKHLANLSPHRSLRGRLLRRLRPTALERHALLFLAYVRDYHAVPEAAEDSGDGKLAKAPWILRIVETLRRNGYGKRWFHFWHDPAWDMPTGEAFFRYATLQELDGAELDLLDDDEKALLAMAREAVAARTPAAPPAVS